MGKQKLDRLKKTLPILLVVLFVLSVTATAINAKATLPGTPANETNNALPTTNETTMTMTANAAPGDTPLDTNVTLAGNHTNKTTEIVAEGGKIAAYRNR